MQGDISTRWAEGRPAPYQHGYARHGRGLTELCRISETRCNLAILRGTGVSSSFKLWQTISATSSAASACLTANSVARPISARVPEIIRSMASNLLRAILPILLLPTRSFSESSAESDE